MSYVVKLSRLGYNYNTNDPRQLIYSSQYNNFKIHSALATDITIPASTLTATKNIAHGLGYAPAFIAYAESQNVGYEAYRQLVNDFFIEPGSDYTGLSIHATTTNISIYAERDILASHYPAAKTINIYLFIFKEVSA